HFASGASRGRTHVLMQVHIPTARRIAHTESVSQFIPITQVEVSSRPPSAVISSNQIRHRQSASNGPCSFRFTHYVYTHLLAPSVCTVLPHLSVFSSSTIVLSFNYFSSLLKLDFLCISRI